MGTDRAGLPQLEERVYLTDGGLETTLLFLEGFELPDFAAFHLLRSAVGRQALERYFASYADLGERFRALRQRLGRLTILGGCCGTDQRHIEAIAAACAGSR